MLLRTSSESNLRPISRFTAKTVASGLVIACRLAICPTSRSPTSVNPTIDGVVRLPSELGITTGSPPSITATQLFVVPRSIPMTLGMEKALPRSVVPQGPRRLKTNGNPGAWESSALSPTLWIRRRVGRSRCARFGHHDRGGPDQPVVELVAFGHLRDHGPGRLVALLLHERLVHTRVERLAQGGETDHSVLRQRGLEELLHQADAFDDLRQVVLLGVIERALQVVQHRQEILQQPLNAEPLHVLLLLHGALLEVVELGRGAQQAVVGLLQPISRLSRALEGLLELRFHNRELFLQPFGAGGRPGIGAGFRHRPLLVHRRVWRDLRIVGNQVFSFKRGGNIAQRSGSPRGEPQTATGKRGNQPSSSVNPTVRAVSSTRGITRE